jgi:hypothetical protein
MASVGGTCGGTFSGNTYTTKAISANCTVTAAFAQGTYTVTPSVSGTGGTISPATAVSVKGTATTVLALKPNAGYAASSVGGTCGGTLSGNTFTTKAITANCTVVATFAVTHTVTASAGTGGTINPSGAISVAAGATKAFTVTPNTGYKVSSVGGTCGGTLSGSTYTTKAITANCTVMAAFVLQTYTVTASAGTGGTISPSGTATVNYGATKAFTLTPNTGYKVSSVGGTCGGTLSGNTYTTKAITANCAVTVAFALQTYTVTSSAGTGGAISPSGATTVNYGATKVFTVTPSTGYKVSVGGTCGGTLSGNIFTTQAITVNCTVTATFALQATSNYIMAVADSGGSIIPSGPNPVASGTTKTFTVTPYPGYTISAISGSCGGTLNGNIFRTATYTTAAITSNCTVVATFSPPQPVTYYTVTANAGPGGTISPSGTVLVPLASMGTTKTFTITPNAGYNVSSEYSTCGNTFSGIGPSYTLGTAPQNSNCTVGVTFSQTAPVVTITFKTDGPGGEFNLPGSIVVPSGYWYNFRVFPNQGYSASLSSNCDKALLNPLLGSSISSTVDCTVTATFIQQ